ncbi:hypothetical protein JW930_05930 [Candidatus Woesearchaeota archaeon]|nr:hypothetical protein [Candidatus Woesearchaeota archaeon]
MDIIIVSLLVMLAYDLSIHIIYLFRKEQFFFKRKINYWPDFGQGKNFNRLKYDLFWTVYWGIAFILIILSFYQLL